MMQSSVKPKLAKMLMMSREQMVHFKSVVILIQLFLEGNGGSEYNFMLKIRSDVI